MKAIDYTVDDEPQTTTDKELTAREILQRAGLNPAERYLTLLNGKHQERLEPDKVVHMHEHMKFISAFIGPVPVS